MLANFLVKRMLEKGVDTEPVLVFQQDTSLLKPPTSGCTSFNPSGGLNLYIGTAAAAWNLDALKRAKIKYIVSIHQSLEPAFPYDFKYLTIPVRDKPDQDITDFFPKVTSFVWEAVGETQGETSILFHCMAGKSRSSAFIAAFLIDSCNVKSLQEAMELIRLQRPEAAPNLGFAAQLRAFARKVHGVD
mmetsp:Transcript_12851/g.16667  ORF Transcript_12851/g.16667 Transcript_12851/m.16667 type:complete len:188 (-) Transcript_12851:870-1433(-)